MFKAWNDCLYDAGGKNVATLDCVPTIFLNILAALLAFAGLTALVMFIIGGTKYMTSAGDSKKLEGAKNTFVFGIIGLSLVLFSFLLINLVSTVTGIECIKKFGFGCN